ncbi:tetratricopeptide repeat protein [Amorphus coralli]|uniref:tetratricopeptide repeat protein n=1 Tax=Amorphus coralli TaxID=340680 RepID=UPI00036DB89A|nr:tetratricopeptide repeat protein [Amorphus coralli]
MRTYEFVACALFAGAFLTFQAADVRAADALPPVPAAPPAKTSTLLDTFRDGVRAYYRGDKAAAVDKLRTAAESDHTMAQWKLGRMYADGDGVDEDDLKAFEYFSRVANAHVDELPNSPQAPFVADAIIELGDYYLTGIQDSAVKPNVDRARNLYTYAASYFGSAQAQYRLGRMYLETQETGRDPRLAARWLKLSAEKGNPEAQALLGDLLFFGEEMPRRPVTGLMWLTIARKTASGPDSGWIRERQERAFTRASDDERKRATQLADAWIGSKKTN